jgi:hypothetical protein
MVQLQSKKWTEEKGAEFDRWFFHTFQMNSYDDGKLCIFVKYVHSINSFTYGSITLLRYAIIFLNCQEHLFDFHFFIAIVGERGNDYQSLDIALPFVSHTLSIGDFSWLERTTN